MPGRHELRARRRLGAGGRGHRRCRSNGNRGRAPALGAHAALALRPGSPVPQRPPRAGAARRRALPVGGPQPFGGAVGARRPAGPHRMGGRRDELAQRRLALLARRLRAGARAAAARAVRAAQRGQRPVALLTTAGTTGRSTSRASGVGCGRCSTRRPTSACRSCTRASGSAPVDRYGSAELCLDVTAGPAAEALEIAPVLRFDAAEETRHRRAADPVHRRRGARRGVRVAGAGRVDPDPRTGGSGWPGSPPRRRRRCAAWSWSGSGCRCRPDQQARFRDEFYPRLSRLAPVTSSDGVVHPAGHLRARRWCCVRPTATGTTLTLRLGVGLRGRRHAGRASRSRPPARDEVSATARTERAVLDALDLSPFATRAAAADGPGPPCCRRSGSTGSTPCGSPPRCCRCWPDTAGVVVEVERRAGRLPGGGRLAADRRVHRRVGRRAPTGSTSASRITVEGREVPFADVFVALAAGESHLLLPDGAYFSLREARAAGAARADRGGAGAAGRAGRARCGSAASRPGCGTSWPRSASSTRQAQAWQRQVDGPAGARRGPASRRRPPTLRAQLRPYQRDGLRLAVLPVASTGSAASSPTTWGWARRCRRWR